MNLRPFTFALALLAIPACDWASGHFTAIDLGVEVRLNAVDSIACERGFIAVGSNGTVVRDDGKTWDLGDVELRDVVHMSAYFMESPQVLLWTRFSLVVGDAGTIVVGRRLDGQDDMEWVTQDSGTSANLYGIANLDDTTPYVVGDEIVLRGEVTEDPRVFDWIPEPAPPGGWGSLRDIEEEWDRVRLRAGGLEGRMWILDAQSGGWESVHTGTDEDLLDLFSSSYADGRACGSGGAIVNCRDGIECSSQRLGEAELVACDQRMKIGTDARIRFTDWDHHKLIELDWQPRGIDESCGFIMVGDGGRAGYYSYE